MTNEELARELESKFSKDEIVSTFETIIDKLEKEQRTKNMFMLEEKALYVYDMENDHEREQDDYFNDELIEFCLYEVKVTYDEDGEVEDWEPIEMLDDCGLYGALDEDGWGFEEIDFIDNLFFDTFDQAWEHMHKHKLNFENLVNNGK